MKTKNNIWKTTHALTAHYIRLTNYGRVLERELAKVGNPLEYFIRRQMLLTELLVGVIKKIMSSKINMEIACSDYMEINYRYFNDYLKDGRFPSDKDLTKMAKYINS